jgi:hypothetical protein
MGLSCCSLLTSLDEALERGRDMNAKILLSTS